MKYENRTLCKEYRTGEIQLAYFKVSGHPDSFERNFNNWMQAHYDNIVIDDIRTFETCVYIYYRNIINTNHSAKT